MIADDGNADGDIKGENLEILRLKKTIHKLKLSGAIHRQDHNKMKRKLKEVKEENERMVGVIENLENRRAME